MNQRQNYIDNCVRLRLLRDRGEITDLEYQEKLMFLGRECQQYLLGPVEDLVDMFREIKEAYGQQKDGVV